MTDSPSLYDIYKWRGRRLVLGQRSVSFEFAANLLGIDADEFAWALEERGRCDAGRYVVICADDPAPGELGDEQ